MHVACKRVGRARTQGTPTWQKCLVPANPSVIVPILSMNLNGGWYVKSTADPRVIVL